MSSSYRYRQVSQILGQSLNSFEEVDTLFGADSQGDESEASNRQALKERWRLVLTQSDELAGYVQTHHRAQSPQVLAALEEVAKYSDVRRPFRLSVIGQKGVGKSALVNALLGASRLDYTPSEVAGKAVSGTRIRLLARRPGLEVAAPWHVVFLTPRRLWEIGSYLLNVARLDVPRPPSDLDSREQVVRLLTEATSYDTNENSASSSNGIQNGSALQILAANARDTLVKILAVYRETAHSFSEDYSFWINDPDVDGQISPYLRQTESGQYLVVDYVERYLEPEEAGFLAGRPIELEDVLGLDDPRDSFFALEAFKEAFAVLMVFKCDRGLNTESTGLLQNLFSRDEAELAQYGSYADLNKAIIVANQFDNVTANVALGGNKASGNPLKGIEDIRRELSRYTRQPIPIYLTSAQLSRQAQARLNGSSERPSAAYSFYLQSLANLLAVMDESRQPSPDYLDFVQARRADIENAAFDPANLTESKRASLVLEMSGLTRLTTKVQEALEAKSILRGRIANAEYYYSRAIAESAVCYARRMREFKLDLAEFNQLPASLESRLFAKFQHEIRGRLEELDLELKQSYFNLARRYVHGPMPAEVEEARQYFLNTIQKVMVTNTQLIQMEQHISTGETVTDSWRKVFEDINDWLTLESGRQMTGLVGPLIMEVEKLTGNLQKQLTTLSINPLEESFQANYQARLNRLRQRLQLEAEVLALGFHTDHRFSVYDVRIAEALHVGESTRRREAVVQLMQERVRSWYNQMWHLLAKVAMTDLSSFVAEVRHYVLGLHADGSLRVGFEQAGQGAGILAPETSLTAILNQRYHSEPDYRKQYAMREPTPTERLAAEIREWLELVRPPMDGLAELGKALAIVGVGAGLNLAATEADSEDEAGEAKPENTTEGGVGGYASPDFASISTATSRAGTAVAEADAPGRTYTRLSFPIESRHPYLPITRQFWEITNPDEKARYTRLHFSRIDLGTSQNSSDRITLTPLGKQEGLTINGKHSDLWTEALPGRTIKINFSADNAQPGWGFVLDAVETVLLEEFSGK